MKKDHITDFEDAIAQAKQEFSEEFKQLLQLVKQPSATQDQVQEAVTELHEKGVAFVDLFSRSLNEYGTQQFKHNPNIRNSKRDDAVNLSNTLLKYWKLIRSLQGDFDILPPKPSERAYSSIQSFLKTFDKEAAQTLQPQFEALQLPTYGFKTKKPFIDMTKKQQVTFGALTGLGLLLILLVIALVVECPTNFQSTIFIIILSLAGAAFASIIPGLIEVKYRQIITATGALAVFVIIFFMKPTQLSDYTGCVVDRAISGTTYFGDTPVENMDVSVPKQNKSTRTDNFGNFQLSLDFTAIEDKLGIHLQNNELRVDTVYTFTKEQLAKSLDIKIKKYCVACTQKDSTGAVVNQKTTCSASASYIEDYIKGFTQAGVEQGRTVECTRQ